MATTTGIPGAPLGEMLEHQRLALRERQLAAVIGALRTRSHGYESPPRSLLAAIADFSTQLESVRRRLTELAADARSATPPAGRVHG